MDEERLIYSWELSFLNRILMTGCSRDDRSGCEDCLQGKHGGRSSQEETGHHKSEGSSRVGTQDTTSQGTSYDG